MSIADKLTAVAENEQKVYDAGFKAGQAEGGDTDTAYTEGVTEGKKVQNEEFWSNFVSGRGDLSYCFYGWNGSAFYPSVNFTPSESSRMFYYFNWSEAEPINLKERLEQCGVTIDFSKSRGVAYMFGNSKISHIPELKFLNVTKLEGVLNNSEWIETVDKIVLKEDGSNTFTETTFNAKNLKNITFEGTIGTSVTFQHCTKLSAESYHSIIKGCSKTAAFTLTLPPETTVRSVYDATYGSGAWDTITAEYGNLTIAYT